jgi:hypothetical protein
MEHPAAAINKPQRTKKQQRLTNPELRFVRLF